VADEHPARPRGPEDWRSYYEKTGDRPPRSTLLCALALFDSQDPPGDQRLAVDLGSGNGRDTVELLRRGWRVLAIDAEAAAIEGLLARPGVTGTGRLETKVARFEDADLPGCDLVNSSFALPLCPPAAFPRVWQAIRGALGPGGRFAGQLYGDRDSWVGNPTITFHTRAELDALLAGFDIEHFREEEEDSVTPRGKAKHWHIFHVVARKMAGSPLSGARSSP
jgi:SAM-dependent methyltransferase